MPAQQSRRWTAREVRQLISDAPLATPRYELVGGELLVTPSPAFTHQTVVRELLIALGEYLRAQPVATVVTSPSDVELEEEDIRQPDIFVTSKSETQRVIAEGNPVRQLLRGRGVVGPA